MDANAVWTLLNLLILGCEWNPVPFLKINGADGYQRRHIHFIGKLPRRCSRVLLATPPEASGGKAQQKDMEVAEQLEKQRAEEMAKYLSPMEAANVQGINQRTLDDSFGEPYTPENARKRGERSERMMDHMAPEVPPTKDLPYFVNLQNPKKPLGDILSLEEETYNGQPPVVVVGRNAGNQQDIGELNKAGSNSEMQGMVNSVTTAEDAPKDIDAANDSASTTNATDGTDNVDTDKVQSDEDKPDSAKKGTNLALLRDPREALFEEHANDKFEGDPLDPYFEAAAQPASSDEEEVDPEEEERQRLAWYRDKPANRLFPADMTEGWSILPCGRIYKHLLKPSHIPPDKQRRAGPESYVSFGFKVIDAFTGDMLLEAADMKSDGIISQLKDLGAGLQKMVASMVTGEQAEFICHAVELDIADLKEEGAENLQWIRVWINFITMHERGERWWHLSPLEASKYPKAEPETGNLTKMERLNLKTEQLKKQIETELANNPCSPLWEDVMPKLTTQQKASVVEHFDRKLELQERRKCAEFSGSRGFGEAIKDTGQLMGYDVGRSSGGCGAFYSWHETPFIVYIAVPVVPGIRAEHVRFKLEPSHLTLNVGNKTVIDDDTTAQVETDISTNWAMSEKAMEYDPLPAGHPDLDDPVLHVGRDDEYHKLIKEPCIIIALRKQDKAMGDWGTPFVNI